MGSGGDCFDNAMCESFFATLECELLNRRSFKTQVEARTAVFDFIEDWYNPHRRHSALDYLSLINYERNHSAQADYRSPTPSTESGLNQPFPHVHRTVCPPSGPGYCPRRALGSGNCADPVGGRSAP